jgi:hypothetical protein
VVRRSLLLGHAPTELGRPMLALVLFALILVPVSVLVFDRALRRARDDGSLTHY